MGITGAIPVGGGVPHSGHAFLEAEGRVQEGTGSGHGFVYSNTNVARGT